MYHVMHCAYIQRNAHEEAWLWGHKLFVTVHNAVLGCTV